MISLRKNSKCSGLNNLILMFKLILVKWFGFNFYQVLSIVLMDPTRWKNLNLKLWWLKRIKPLNMAITSLIRMIKRYLKLKSHKSKHGSKILLSNLMASQTKWLNTFKKFVQAQIKLSKKINNHYKLNWIKIFQTKKQIKKNFP